MNVKKDESLDNQQRLNLYTYTCSEVYNSERSKIQAKKLLSLSVNKTLQSEFLSFYKNTDLEPKFNNLQNTFWKLLNPMFIKYNIKDVRTFIYRVTGKYLQSKTFVKSLRGHRNGINPFWLTVTE